VAKEAPRRQNERGRLCCHKRPKSREETPKEGIGGKNLAASQQYARATHKKQVMLTDFLGATIRPNNGLFLFYF
jgi:hypothetical protein